MIVFLVCFGAFFTPVLLLYLVRRRVRKTVSSLLLWSLPGTRQSAAGPIKPRDVLSLVLHAAFLACLSGALVAGRDEKEAVLPTRVVMVETGGSTSRVNEASALASLKRQIGKTLVSDGSMRHMLVELAWRAEILCPPSSDPVEQATALERLRWQDSPTRLREGLELVQSLRKADGPNEVVLFASGFVSKEDWIYLQRQTVVGPDGRIFLKREGENPAPLRWIRLDRPPTASIAGFHIQQGISSKTVAQAEVTNLRESDETIEVILSTQDTYREARQLSIGPGERRRLAFSLPLQTYGRLLCRLRNPAGQVLTEGFAVAPDRQLRVALVSPGNPFLEAALETDSRIVWESVSPNQYCLPKDAHLLIFDRFVPPLPPPRPALYINPPQGSSPIHIVGRVEGIDRLAWNQEDGIWQRVSPADWSIQASWYFDEKESQALLRANERAIMAAFSKSGQGEGIVIGWDLTTSSVPFTSGFPVWLTDLVWRLGRGAHFDAPVWTGLTSVRSLLPTDRLQEWRVHDPEGMSVFSWWENGQLQFDARQRGFYRIFNRRLSQDVALNFESESQLHVGELGWKPQSIAARGLSVPGELPTFTWPVLPALILSIAEWMLYRTGRTG